MRSTEQCVALFMCFCEQQVMALKYECESTRAVAAPYQIPAMIEGIFEYETEEWGPEETDGSGEDTQRTGAVLLGIRQERRHLEVPGALGGVPVRRIAPHALSGKKQLRAVSFPESVRSVGVFALHNCPNLEEVSLHDGIRDFHNGVLRQDVRLRRIRLFVAKNNYTVMRDILSDGDARLQFYLAMPDGEARLLFPGYDYAFAENTMARTIQFTISGSGMVYRECVRRKGIGFREYDRLFSRVVHDDPHAAVEIAADRLLCPYDLAPVHRDQYTDYLRTHAQEALLQFVGGLEKEPEGPAADEVYERLRLMADRGMISGSAADAPLRAGADAGLTEACSIILGGREKALRPVSGAAAGRDCDEKEVDDGCLSLDDW